MLEKLKKDVCDANISLEKYGLVVLTWGNVSGIDRKKGLVVIKPSGVEYKRMKPADMVVVNFNGDVMEGKKHPSSDTPTHLELYRAFPEIGGITHTHSTYATIFAQAGLEIPCLGTTHADQFFGSVPVTRLLSEREVESDYEKNTGRLIVDRLKDTDVRNTPGILAAGHGAFCWGDNASQSVENSLILERIAEMAFRTMQLNPEIKQLPSYIVKKHYMRKHGENAYYGQKHK